MLFDVPYQYLCSLVRTSADITALFPVCPGSYTLTPIATLPL